MWDIRHMRVMSLVAVVAPRTGLKEDKICYRGILRFLFKPIVRNRGAKLEFK